MRELTEVKAIVSVDGTRMDFISLKIHQRMSEHHQFELVIDHKTFDNHFFDSPEKKLTLVNKKVVIDLQPGENIGKAYVFSGLIDSVRILNEEGMHGSILLSGRSSTVELERGKICQTYSNTNLYTIVKEVTADTVNLTVHNIPDWKSDIAFAIQYKEDDWSFLRRILHQYQVAYHYNGLDLIVGQYPDYPVVDLTYDHELRSLEVCSRLLPNDETNYFYRREDHSTIYQDTPKEISDANYFLQQVSKRSDYLTRRRKPNAPVEAYVADMDGLINQMERKKVSTGAEMMYVRGSVKTIDVLIGRLIHIQFPKSMGGSDIGTYRVYEVTHQLDQNGRYICDFEAVPADLKYLPTPRVRIPVINPITVECWSNEDPLGIGRVKVKFPFDERPCDIYIPQMTPDAGGNGTGLGPVSRGYSFVAEVGDSLLVSFLDEQLSEPFVMGSMFHGANAKNLGGGKGNHIKTITDKSEGQILFNTNEKGDWGITIHDRNGNIINLDTRGKNISITAPETVSITAKNIIMSAEEDIKSMAGEYISSSAGINISGNAGVNMNFSAGRDYTLLASNIKEIANESFSSEAKEIEQNALSDIIIQSTEGKIVKHAQQRIDNNSGEKSTLH